MLKLRPSLTKILFLFFLLIISSIAIRYSLLNINVSSLISYYSITTLIILILSILAFLYSFSKIPSLFDFWRIDFESNTITCKSAIVSRTIEAKDIDLIALITPDPSLGDDYRLIFYEKNNNSEQYAKVSSEIFWFKKSDVKNLINQLIAINPSIKLSPRVKDYMAGKILWPKILSPSKHNNFEDSEFYNKTNIKN